MHARLTLQSYGQELAAHAHGWCQLVLPLSGALDIDIDGHGGRVTRGTLAWIDAGQRHAFHASTANRFLVADLPGTIAAPLGFARRSPFLPQPPGSGPAALALVRRHGAAAMPALLSMLAPTARGSHELQRLALAIERMRAQPQQSHTVVTLAAEVGLRPARFRALFAAATGLSPRAFLSECRLDRAESLLRDTRMTLAEIALACGYSEQSALTRALARERGITPGLLRRG